MLRSSSLSLVRCWKHPSQPQRLAFTTTTTRNLRQLLQVSEPSLWSTSSSNKFSISTILRQTTTSPSRRAAFSSQANNKNGNPEKESSDIKDADGNSNEATSSELVLTPGEKVVVASRLLTWSVILGLCGVCGYYIVRELFPSKMSPNRTFDRAFQVIKSDPEVRQRFGEIIKAYGRDHGGHREGRRNFIEHTEYTSQDDGSKRTRIRFNLEARNGNAFVFAEVSSKMKADEFVYVLVQDKQTGRVITVIDNRAAITAARLAGDNKEGLAAMTQLLTGSGKKN